MRSSVIRPPRGRPAKVTKNTAPARRHTHSRHNSEQFEAVAAAAAAANVASVLSRHDEELALAAAVGQEEDAPNDENEAEEIEDADNDDDGGDVDVSDPLAASHHLQHKHPQHSHVLAAAAQQHLSASSAVDQHEIKGPPPPTSPSSQLEQQYGFLAAAAAASAGPHQHHSTANAGPAYPSSATAVNDPSLDPALQGTDRPSQYRRSFTDMESDTATAGNGGRPPRQPQYRAPEVDMEGVIATTATTGTGSSGLTQTASTSAPAGTPTAEQLARESGYHDLKVDSALAKRLAKEPGLRPAVQRREEQVLNLNRRSNVEALLAHVSGERAASQCKNCHKGHGPWNDCIVVGGQMCGSCANCWFNASGSRCSFHETNNPQAHLPAVHPPSLLPAPAGTSAFGISPTGAPVGHLAFSSPSSATGAAAVATASSSGSQYFDPAVKYIVDKALADVRGVDAKTRLFMRVESHAKALALAIAEYEEFCQAEAAATAAAAAAAATTAGAATTQAQGHQHQHQHQHQRHQPPSHADESTQGPDASMEEGNDVS